MGTFIPSYAITVNNWDRSRVVKLFCVLFENAELKEPVDNHHGTYLYALIDNIIYTPEYFYNICERHFVVTIWECNIKITFSFLDYRTDSIGNAFKVKIGQTVCLEVKSVEHYSR